MSFLATFDISAQGLSAQRFRTNIISSNIANAKQQEQMKVVLIEEKMLFLNHLILIKS